MSIIKWQEKFAHDFRTKKFTGESLEENTEQAIKYFTDYFTSEIETARSEEREKLKEKLVKLHRKSGSRASELECSQDGYELGIEDSISSIK